MKHGIYRGTSGRKIGRRSYIAHCLSRRFGTSWREVMKHNPLQLIRCKDNAAIRLILGVSE